VYDHGSLVMQAIDLTHAGRRVVYDTSMAERWV